MNELVRDTRDPGRELRPLPQPGIPAALQLLRCPRCGSTLRHEAVPAGDLRCTGCGAVTPVRDGIPRFVEATGDDLSRRTQETFGYEWNEFSDWTASGETNFADYFAGFPLEALAGATVLDAGCGMGRHARHVARFAGQVVAVDFSGAIDAAARNLRDVENVLCVQADLRCLPVEDEQFDFVYSLGVLHHIEDTRSALRHLVRKTKLGGRVRIYVYWKRTGIAGALLSGAVLMRRVTTRLPMKPLKGVSWVLSVLLAGALVGPYRLLARAGVEIKPNWPLSVYTKYPFRVLHNDQFDRLSAPLEKRYDADEVRELLESSGLVDVRVFGRYGWIGEGTRSR